MAIPLKIIILTLEVLLIIAAFDVCAQWTPGKTVVYMGDLNLMRSSGSSASIPIMTGSNSETSGSLGNTSAVSASATNNSSISNSTTNSSSMSGTEMINSSTDVSVNASSMNAPETKISPKASVIDLSHYSKDRRDKNLAGYRNIMYPFAESRGSTTSTAGGCGCG